MSQIKSKGSLVNSLQSFLGGMGKHFANQKFVVAGQVVDASTIEAAVTRQIAGVNAIAAAKATWMQAVQAQRSQLAADVRPYIVAVRHYAAAMFGTGSAQYQDFGFQPPKTPVYTAIAKTKAVLQRAATRVARHTMSAKQKQRIRGVVDDKAIAAALASSTPAPSSGATTPTVTPPSGGNGPSH